MAKFIYEVRIHTEDYIPRKTTWKPENKVINQFMEGLGEWSATSCPCSRFNGGWNFSWYPFRSMRLNPVYAVGAEE